MSPDSDEVQVGSQNLISVFVPSYNHEHFVEAALRSLIAQTYAHLELVVIDDGSTDSTFARIQALLSALHQRFVRVDVLQQDHQGVARSIHRGLGAVHSDIVYMLDSDDVADPGAIERLAPLLTARAEVALAVGDNRYVDADGQFIGLIDDGVEFRSFIEYHTRKRPEFQAGRDFGTYPSLVVGNYVPNGWLLRRSHVLAVGGYQDDYILDDWAVLLRLAKRYRIAFVPEALASYRIHSSNVHRTRRDRLAIDTACLLVREQAYSRGLGIEEEWWSHAAMVFGGLNDAQLHSPELTKQLLPESSPQSAEGFQAFASGLADAKVGVTLSAGYRPPAVAGSRPRVHLFATCWNDARMLGFFFRHYDPLVERYIIFDDGSTDGSLEILRTHPRVEVRTLEWRDKSSFVNSERQHYDSCWKESRETADWVMVVDLDEHLVHADLLGYLAWGQEQGITVIPALGYEMQSEEFPSPDELLCSTRIWGAPSTFMSKLSLFAPKAIQEINFSPGGHTASPVGQVLAPPRDELMLFHYKLLGLDYVGARYRELGAKLAAGDKEQGWGNHWNWTQEELLASWRESQSQLIDVRQMREAPWRSFSAARWWTHLPRLPARRGYALTPRQEAVWEALERDRNAHLQSLTAERDAALSAEASINKENELLLAATGALKAELAVALAELDVHRGRQKELTMAVDLARGETAAARRDLEGVVSSVSWRLTGPLRGAVRRIRGY